MIQEAKTLSILLKSSCLRAGLPLIMFFLTSIINAQTKNEFNIGGGIIVSPDKNGAGGFEIVGEILKNKEKVFNNGISLGLGLLFPMDSPTLGESYDGILLEVDPSDLIETGIKKDPGIHLSLGYTFWRFTLGGRIGMYGSSYYEQGFNSIMGIHHITRHHGEHFLSGGYLNVKILKWVGVSAGYDNYSTINLGLNFRYTFDESNK